jgi:ribose/xylose/arabinose/galactoside ABC-type transport system permease subunit
LTASAAVDRPAPAPAPAGSRRFSGISVLWRTREVSTLFVLALEVAFFTWYLWPDGARAHPFFNLNNGVLILKYSALYGIAAIGAAMVIISGGVDLAPGAVMALSGVVTGSLFVESGLPLGVAVAGGLAIGLLAGALSATLVTVVRLPPFIATLGVMGIARGAGFIITEGRYFDLSSRIPAGWRPFGIPADWLAPIVLLVLAAVFQMLMTGFQWGRSVFAIGGNETAAHFSGIRVGRVKASVYVIAAFLASLSGIILVTVQGQGRADLATGYELDIIASSVVGGASLSGGRGSVVGAVLGTLIFGVLRNALPQIPGATFYDRLIVGVVVVVIVVVDQFLVRKGG